MTEDTPTVLARWVDAVETELGLPHGSIDVTEVLDLARDAAHHVARPAAPVTAYLVGYARGLAAASDGATHQHEPPGGTERTGPAVTAPPAGGDVSARASRLALGWPTNPAEAG
ncbi:DUF6457 domain-containing protein [Isoptericola jiangsuensis]|uniref:DUF6457 domain-containing protein n=1 Tax=Isoptericola jiangsuensis TaxID=548579 RepID=UPI003AACBFA3